MKYSSIIPKTRIRWYCALLLAGILALGAGPSPVRASSHYFTRSTGAFNLSTNWDPEASSNPEGIQDRYINNGGTAFLNEDVDITFNELHLGNGNLEMVVGKLMTGHAGGWTFIGDWDARGTGYTSSHAMLTMSGSSGLTVINPLYIGRGNGETEGSATGTVNLSGDATIVHQNTVLIASAAGRATVALSSDSMIKTSAYATANFFVGVGDKSDGTLVVTQYSAVETRGGFAIGLNGGTGSVMLTGHGTLTKLGSSDNTFTVGDGEGSVGTLTVKDDAEVSTTGNLVIGKQHGSGKVTMTDNATFTVSAERIWVGGEQSAGSVGELELSGNATMTYTGSNSYGFTIGDANTTGTVTLSGSSKLTSTGGSPLLMLNGDGPNLGTATLTVGGMNSVVDFDSYITVGQRGASGSTATLNINAGGTVKAAYVNLGGSIATPASDVNGTINLNGGVLETGYVRKGASDSNATRNRLLVDGGTLMATGDQADFIQGGLYVEVKSGGVKIDTQSFEIGIDTNLVGEGGLTKLGSGRLTFNSDQSYAGDTMVQEGTLVLNVTSISTSGYRVSDGATLDLATDDFTPATITADSGATVRVSGSNADLGNSTFSGGNVVIDGSASGLVTTGNAVRVGGDGTLSDFSDAATFVPSHLTLENTIWADGTTFEFNLGVTALSSTGTSDFSAVSDGGLLVAIVGLSFGVQVGDRVALMMFEDDAGFQLDRFVITSGISGFSGSLYQAVSGDSLVLGVQVDAVPEPGVIGLIALGGLALLYARYRGGPSRNA